MGEYVPVFQIAQDIPLTKYNYTTGAGGPALEDNIELSNSSAAIFLTVYPNKGFAAVTTQDFTDLGTQILGYAGDYNRTTFLRYAPEMQGTWNLYGQQPTEFIASFRAMRAAVEAVAPNTIFVWAPNTPQGYPYGQTGDAYTSLSTADQTALDTNGDGVFNSTDDSLSPYWPGEEYVDWIGLSLYYKGDGQGTTGDTANVAQTAGYCAQAIDGVNPQSQDVISNWYDYCRNYTEIPCMWAESGAAYHIADTAGDTRLEIQTAWINDCITNTSMFTQFPQIRMIMQFEYEKVETSNENTLDDRDYRVTNDTEVLAVLKNGFSTASQYWQWATSQAQPTYISSANAPPAQTNSAGETISQAITATTRGRPTSFPSLFGLQSAASQMAEVIELSVLVASGAVGALAVMRYL